MKKFFIVFSLFFLSILNLNFISAKEEKEKSNASYINKAEEFYYLVLKNSMDNYYSKDLQKKDIAQVLQKYFNEEELEELLLLYKKTAPLKLHSNLNSIQTDLQMASSKRQEANSEKESSKSLKSKEVGEEQVCKDEMSRQIEEITKGIHRIKNACGTNYPIKLDRAEDGKADYENKMFNYVLDYGKEAGWIKKGNVYTYSCGKMSKSFSYSSEDGTFK